MKNLDIVQTIKRVSSSVFFFFACMLMIPDITVGDTTVGPSKFHCVLRWSQSRVRLICGTADRGTRKPAEPAEPKEKTVLLQLPFANVIK